MIKKIFVTLIAMFTLFFTNSQAWAATSNADKTSEVYTIEKSDLLKSDSSFEISKGIGARNTNNMLWIASIFVGGLGQILMGDVGRGLKFLIIEAIALVLPVVLLPLLLTSLAALGGIMLILSPILYLVFLAVHIWNIIDAYNMSQETGGMSKLNVEELANTLEKTMEFANNVKGNNNGSVAFKALAF